MNIALTCSTRPSRPCATTSHNRRVRGRNGVMCASNSTTSHLLHTCAIAVTPAGVGASGFSHSTCLPASAAIVQEFVQAGRQSDVHALDRVVGE